MTLHAMGAAALVRYGVIGPGKHAQENLLPILAQLGGARLEAIAARRLTSAARAAERWQARFYTDDWRDLVHQGVVDALVVSASPQLHAEVIPAALAAGISVFVEKPPAPDTASLRQLISAEQAAAAGTVAFVGFNFAHGLSYRLLRDRIAKHGELRSMDVRMVSAKPVAPTWGCTTVLESLLQGLGTHVVNLALREFGPPNRVNAQRADIDEYRHAVRITLEYADGRLATLCLGNYSNRLEYRCELVTAHGVVGILDELNTLELNLPAVVPGVGRLDGKETVRHRWPIRHGGYDLAGYAPELTSFHDSVSQGLPSASPLTDCLDTWLILDEVASLVAGGVPGGER